MAPAIATCGARTAPQKRHAMKPIAVEAREGHRIWLRYADGVEGEVDLSHLAGQGVFAAWLDPAFFRQVHIAEYDGIAWNDEIDLCPTALYLELTGKSPEEVLSGLTWQKESA